MFNRFLTILYWQIKVGAIFILLVAMPKLALAQSCECIDEPNCVPCEGGFNSITFEYSGEIGIGDTYIAKDDGGQLGPILPQILTDDITINSRNINEAFEGGYIEITIFSILLPDEKKIEVVTSCQQIEIGKEYDNGNFTITEARSIAGPLCCEPEDTDQVPPEFVNFPVDTIISLEEDCEVQYSWTQPTVIDDCGIAGFLPPVPSNNQIFDLGTRNIIYKSIDLSGNIFTDSFSVTVIDEISPAISNIPENIELEVDNNCQAIASWNMPTASDNCQVVGFSANFEPESAFELGTTEVIYTATDESGNETTESFNVIVSDNISPEFLSFPQDTTVSANENCEAVVNWEIPVASDNCNNNIEPEADQSPGDTFPLGTTPVNYIATDESGNEVTRSFNIVVLDNSAPVFQSFPEDTIVSIGNSCEIPVTWETPVIEDNCNEANLVLMEGSPESGDVFTLGISTVSYKASDANGNEITQSFKITVVDDMVPVFTGCPQQDIVISAGASCDALVEWEKPQATDNCALLELTTTIESGTKFDIGTTEVQYIAIDESGNEAICSFNVIITNDFEPVIENCPQDVELELFNRAGVRHEWEEPSLSLECATLKAESNYNPGDIFPQGSTEVKYFYELNGEKVVFCSFMVNVELAEIDFEVTQLMTPNGDGINDQWRIKELEKFPNNSVTILDRWGGEIYSAKGYNNENIVWDGSNKRGDLVPTGTYYYIIKVEFESSVKETNGFIELIR